MNTRHISRANSTALYLVVIAVIVVAFLLLGGGAWLKGIGHTGRALSIASWNWTTILISMGIGFMLGLLVSRRK